VVNQAMVTSNFGTTFQTFQQVPRTKMKVFKSLKVFMCAIGIVAEYSDGLVDPKSARILDTPEHVDSINIKLKIGYGS
jgi:hypothetical protein